MQYCMLVPMPHRSRSTSCTSGGRYLAASAASPTHSLWMCCEPRAASCAVCLGFLAYECSDLWTRESASGREAPIDNSAHFVAISLVSWRRITRLVIRLISNHYMTNAHTVHSNKWVCEVSSIHNSTTARISINYIHSYSISVYKWRPNKSQWAPFYRN